MRAWRVESYGEPAAALRLAETPAPEPGPRQLRAMVAQPDPDLTRPVAAHAAQKSTPGHRGGAVVVLRRPQREDRVVLQVPDSLGRGVERAPYDGLVRIGRERGKLRLARRRQRKAPHGGDNPVELEGLRGAGIHTGYADWRSEANL